MYQRGELQCIGATTLDEHRKYIEKDAALERRFQPVIIDEPTEPDTLAILEGLKGRFERHHRCIYDAGALEAAVSLSARYVADRQLPDKVRVMAVVLQCIFFSVFFASTSNQQLNLRSTYTGHKFAINFDPMDVLVPTVPT